MSRAAVRCRCLSPPLLAHLLRFSSSVCSGVRGGGGVVVWHEGRTVVGNAGPSTYSLHAMSPVPQSPPSPPTDCARHLCRACRFGVRSHAQTTGTMHETRYESQSMLWVVPAGAHRSSTAIVATLIARQGSHSCVCVVRREKGIGERGASRPTKLRQPKNPSLQFVQSMQ